MRLTGAVEVRIDESSVIEFFDGRARAAVDAAAPGVTMLQDGQAALVRERDRIEAEALAALLDARAPVRPRTLDLGCGAGRLYFALRERLGPYVGIDGSPSLIAAAQRRSAGDAAACFLVHDLGRPGLAGHWRQPAPQLALMSGILMYLNDASLAQLLGELAALLRGPALLVLREPVGIDLRLSLKDHWSEELKSNYSAIYRQRDEYRAALAAAFGARLSRFESSWLFDASALNNRVETRQALMIAEVE